MYNDKIIYLSGTINHRTRGQRPYSKTKHPHSLKALPSRTLVAPSNSWATPIFENETPSFPQSTTHTHSSSTIELMGNAHIRERISFNPSNHNPQALQAV